MIDEVVYIYYLLDPETMDVRYVGKSIEPMIRIVLHQRVIMPNHPKWEWVLSLKEKGLAPILKIVECCDRKIGKSREEHYISINYDSGKLFNMILPNHIRERLKSIKHSATTQQQSNLKNV
jgi:hypothetical protein